MASNRQKLWPPSSLGNVYHNPYIRQLMPLWATDWLIVNKGEYDLSWVYQESDGDALAKAQAAVRAEVIKGMIMELLGMHVEIHRAGDDVDIAAEFAELANRYLDRCVRVDGAHNPQPWHDTTRRILAEGPGVGHGARRDAAHARMVFDTARKQLDDAVAMVESDKEADA